MKRALATASIWLGASLAPLAAQTALDQYQLDDGSFEARIDHPPESRGMEVAQRFTVERGGRLAKVGVCLWRNPEDAQGTYVPVFNFHRDDDGRPGPYLIHFDEAFPLFTDEIPRNEYTCVEREFVFGFSSFFEFEPGEYWVNVFLPSGSGSIPDGPNLPASLAADRNGPAAASVMSRFNETAGPNEILSSWSEWRPVASGIRAVGIRFAIDTDGAGPDPDPDPDPDPPWTGVTHHQEDDGSFEDGPVLEVNWDDSDVPAFWRVEVAQRFEIQGGRVRYLEACFERAENDPQALHPFAFRIYQSVGGSPWWQPLETEDDLIVTAEFPRGSVHCVRRNLETPLQLVDSPQLGADPGVFWVAVVFNAADGLRTTGLGGRVKRLAIDRSSPDFAGPGARINYRVRLCRTCFWPNFLPASEEIRGQAVGIRVGVQHGFSVPPGEGYTDCAPSAASLSFDGHQVLFCYETPDGEIGEGKAGIWASEESGLLWFFDRGNAEALVKVLDGCAINGHRWVFVAPVTDLAFNLYVVPPGGGRPWSHHNAQGRTAEARSDTAAFPCSPSTAAGTGRAAPEDPPARVSLAAVGADGYTDCVPTTSSLVFDGYQVRMCYETPDGETGEGKAGIWASGQSGLLWFFTEGNAEVLVKVLDGCAVNGHRWVFVAPVTDLAFNLHIVPPGEREPWIHRNAQGRTATAKGDTSAFPCAYG